MWVKWVGGEGKNILILGGVLEKKIGEKRGVGGKNWAGVGGLKPGGRGSRPPCPPPQYTTAQQSCGCILVSLHLSVHLRCPSVPHAVFNLWLVAYFMDYIDMWLKYNPWVDDVMTSRYRSQLCVLQCHNMTEYLIMFVQWFKSASGNDEVFKTLEIVLRRGYIHYHMFATFHWVLYPHSALLCQAWVRVLWCYML